MKIPQILTLIHENPSDSYVDPKLGTDKAKRKQLSIDF